MLCLTAHYFNQIIFLPKIWQVTVQTVNTLVYCISWYCNCKSKMTKHSILSKAVKRKYSLEGQAAFLNKISFNDQEIFCLKGFLTLTSDENVKCQVLPCADQ